MESKLYGDSYAKVTWRAEDIQTLKPNWSMDKCEEWLSDYERNISDRLIELGWEVIQTLLDITGDDDE